MDGKPKPSPYLGMRYFRQACGLAHSQEVVKRKCEGGIGEGRCVAPKHKVRNEKNPPDVASSGVIQIAKSVFATLYLVEAGGIEPPSASTPP